MRLLGYEISLKKAAPPAPLSPVWSSPWYGGAWWGGPIRESFPGAWQRNVTIDSASGVLSFSAVFCCVTGIAADIGKMRIKLDRNVDGIWTEITEGSPWLPVLRKPNHFQTHIKFVEQWITSKLLWGNTYVLKQRDQRGIVNALYILDPQRVTPLVADNGDVYYQLNRDSLSRFDEERDLVVPAREIIHDTMVCLWHPLIGVSPIYACGMSATEGNRIQQQATQFFANGARPGGVVMVPGHVSDETVARLKATWEEKFSGPNAGRVAILSDGMTYEGITMPAKDAELIEQLRWTVEDVARAFHYPTYKLGGPFPPYSSGPEAATTMYYTDCLHPLIESFEISLDEGLELPAGMGTELDLDNLLRLDTATLVESNGKAVGGGWMSPNEARFRANLPPVVGGDSPMIQQQNFSLEALAKRDAAADPFAKGGTAEPPPDEVEEEEEEDIEDEDDEEDEEDEEEEDNARSMTLADAEFFETAFCSELDLVQK